MGPPDSFLFRFFPIVIMWWIGIKFNKTKLFIQLVRDGVLTPMRFVEALSSAPACLIPDFEGGSLREGQRADVTVLDPEARWTLEQEALRSKSHNTPLLGRELTGRPVMTIVGGDVVYELET